MPRIAGQIDVAKSEAILDAATAVLAERGLSAPMEEIARRACVSKQTIYNRYGGKADLIRALIERRMADIVAPLETAGAFEDPETALTGFARTLLDAILNPRSAAMMRLYIGAAGEMPDVARAVFEAGPQASRRHLSRFLAEEHAGGRMVVDDPDQAAEFFVGMVIAARQLGVLLGVTPEFGAEEADRIARSAAARFMQAYGV